MSRLMAGAYVDTEEYGYCKNCKYQFNSELILEYGIKHCPKCGSRLYDLHWSFDRMHPMLKVGAICVMVALALVLAGVAWAASWIHWGEMRGLM